MLQGFGNGILSALRRMDFMKDKTKSLHQSGSNIGYVKLHQYVKSLDRSNNKNPCHARDKAWCTETVFCK